METMYYRRYFTYTIDLKCFRRIRRNGVILASLPVRGTIPCTGANTVAHARVFASPTPQSPGDMPLIRM